MKLVHRIGNLSRNSTLVFLGLWDNNINSQVEQLKEYVKKGGHVICLEQDPDKFNQSWLPISVTFLKSSNNDPIYLSPSLAYKSTDQILILNVLIIRFLKD